MSKYREIISVFIWVVIVVLVGCSINKKYKISEVKYFNKKHLALTVINYGFFPVELKIFDTTFYENCYLNKIFFERDLGFGIYEHYCANCHSISDFRQYSDTNFNESFLHTHIPDSIFVIQGREMEKLDSFEVRALKKYLKIGKYDSLEIRYNIH